MNVTRPRLVCRLPSAGHEKDVGLDFNAAFVLQAYTLTFVLYRTNVRSVSSSVGEQQGPRGKCSLRTENEKAELCLSAVSQPCFHLGTKNTLAGDAIGHIGGRLVGMWKVASSTWFFSSVLNAFAVSELSLTASEIQ
eukprot:1159452-Pelagomonas_calceolata.AAC.12